MKEEAIERMKAKGIHDAETVLLELERSGAITHFGLCKYVARERWLERVTRYPHRTPTDIAKDVAHECSIGFSTLRRSL